MKIIIKGKYYKKDENWVAELPAFEFSASHKNPFHSLKNLKSLIESDFSHEDTTLLVRDKGELLLVIPESAFAYQFIARSMEKQKLDDYKNILEEIEIDESLNEEK